MVEVSARVGRSTGQQGCFSLHPDPSLAWEPAARSYDLATFEVPDSEKAEFRRLLHVFGVDAQRVSPGLQSLASTLAWRYQER